MLSSAAPVTMTGPPHFVDLHVNPGETITIQLMDGNETILRGPATLTMVSQQTFPPVPMPIQVPPGHTIQQIVDENGILRQIVLSAVANGTANGTGHPILQSPPGQAAQQQQQQQASQSQCSAMSSGRSNQPSQSATSGQPPPPFSAYPCLCCSCCYCPTGAPAPGLPGSIPPGAMPVSHPAASLLGFPSPGTLSCGSSNSPNGSTMSNRRRAPSRTTYPSYSKRNHANTISSGSNASSNANQPVNSIMVNSGTGSSSPYHHLHHSSALANQVTQQQPPPNLSSSGIVNIASKNHNKNNHINSNSSSRQHPPLVNGMIIPINTSGHQQQQQAGDSNGKHSHHTSGSSNNSSSNNGTSVTSQSELISATNVASVVSDLLKKQQPVTNAGSGGSSKSSSTVKPALSTSPTITAIPPTGIINAPSALMTQGKNLPTGYGRNNIATAATTNSTAATLSSSTLSPHSVKPFKPRNQNTAEPSISHSKSSVQYATLSSSPSSSSSSSSSSTSNHSIHGVCRVNPTCPPSSSAVNLLSSPASSISPNSIDSSSSSSTVSSSSTGYVSDKNSTISTDTNSSMRECKSQRTGKRKDNDTDELQGNNQVTSSVTNRSVNNVPSKHAGDVTSSRKLFANSCDTKSKDNIDSSDRVNNCKNLTESKERNNRSPPVESLDDVTGTRDSQIVSICESPKNNNLNRGKGPLHSSSSNSSTPLKGSRDSTPKPRKKSISPHETSPLDIAANSPHTKVECIASDLPDELKLPGKKSKSTSKSPSSSRGNTSTTTSDADSVSQTLPLEREIVSHEQSNISLSQPDQYTQVCASVTEAQDETDSSASSATKTVPSSLDATSQSPHTGDCATSSINNSDNQLDAKSNNIHSVQNQLTNGSVTEGINSVSKSINNSARLSPRHVASFPQVQMLNLTYTALTASSVKLKWTFQPPANCASGEDNATSDASDSVASFIQRNKLSGSLFNHHFIVEMILNKSNAITSSNSNCEDINGTSTSSSSATSSSTSVRIVYQGNSNTFRVSHLNPGSLYSFKVKTLVSDMQLVSNLLTITTPEQALNSKNIKHRGTNQPGKHQGTLSNGSQNSLTSDHHHSSSPFPSSSHESSGNHTPGHERGGHGASVSLSSKSSDDSLDLVEFTDRKHAFMILLLFTAFALVVAVVVQSLLTHQA